MPKHVRRNPLVETCVTGGFRADVPDLFGAQVIAPMSRDSGGEKPRFWFLQLPVLTKRFQQLRAQGHIAILAALALADVNHHALAVDVFHAQPDQFASSDARGVEQHQDGTRLNVASGINQLGYFLRADDFRNPAARVLRVGYRVRRKASLQGAHEEEAQAGRLCDDSSHRPACVRAAGGPGTGGCGRDRADLVVCRRNARIARQRRCNRV